MKVKVVYSIAGSVQTDVLEGVQISAQLWDSGRAKVRVVGEDLEITTNLYARVHRITKTVPLEEPDD